ncbi:MAG: hypothetical protein FJW19_04285 [Actinobacteria bacterium]|nr:hypothetical protein [Actinomycetota bacterium]
MNDTFFNLISMVAFFAAGIGLLKWINRFEPQWVSRDGSRFSAKMSDDKPDSSKWVEVRVTIDGRQLIVFGRGRRGRQFRGRWLVSYVASTPEAKRRHYVVINEADTDDRAILRVPASSRCVAGLDAIVQR